MMQWREALAPSSQLLSDPSLNHLEFSGCIHEFNKNQRGGQRVKHAKTIQHAMAQTANL